MIQADAGCDQATAGTGHAGEPLHVESTGCLLADAGCASEADDAPPLVAGALGVGRHLLTHLCMAVNE